MDAKAVAEKVAEELFRTIEREKRIVKADFVEAIEKVLRMPPTPEPESLFMEAFGEWQQRKAREERDKDIIQRYRWDGAI